MADRILVFYGSYRRDRQGIRLADYCVRQLEARGCDVELIDTKALDLPMLDRMYKEYPKGEAPEALETLAGKNAGIDAAFGYHHFAHANNSLVKGDYIAGFDGKKMAEEIVKSFGH